MHTIKSNTIRQIYLAVTTLLLSTYSHAQSSYTSIDTTLDRQTIASKAAQSFNTNIARSISLSNRIPNTIDGVGSVFYRYTGLSAADTQTLRSSAYLSSLDIYTQQPPIVIVGTPHQLDFNSGFRKQVTIGAGSSGLKYGDPITLTMSGRVDGTLGLGHEEVIPSGTPQAAFEANATITAFQSLEVFDPSISENIASFSFYGTAHYSEAYFPFTRAYTPINDFIFTSTFSSGYFSNNTPFTSVDPFTSNGYTGILAPILSDNWRSYGIDTGTMSISISTTVGATLEISGLMGISSETLGLNARAFSFADFSNTADFDLSAPANSGIELIGERIGLTTFSDINGQVSSVPEPSESMLVVGGLLGLLGTRRKKSAEPIRQ